MPHPAAEPLPRLPPRLHARGGVLVGAGTHFGTEHHLRSTYGQEPAQLAAALEKASHVLKELSA
jgi:aspartate/methionine/tyrosine aminotransferase